MTAIAEKVAALKTESYFQQRRERANMEAFDNWLEASPRDEPLPGDEP